MPGTVGRYTRIDHFNGRLVVTVEGSGSKLGETKLKENRAKVAGLLGSTDSGVKFGFGRASSSDGLGFAFVGNAAASKHESKTCGGAPITEIVGVSGIEETDELITRRSSGKVGIGGGQIGEEGFRARGEGGDGCRSPKVNSPGAGPTEILGDFLEKREVKVRRSRGKLAKRDDSVTDVGAASDVGIQKLAEEATVGEPVFIHQMLMVVRIFGGANRRVEGRNGISGQRALNFGEVSELGGIRRRRRGPVMSGEHTVDIGRASEHDTVGKLMNIDAIEIGNKAEVSERRRRFTRKLKLVTNACVESTSDGLIRSSKREVIDLPEKQDGDAKKRATVD